MKIQYNLLLFFLTFFLTTQAQENTNKHFIISADKTAKGFLNSIFGNDIVNMHIKLNEKRTLVRNDNIHKYYMLTDYLNDYKPTSVWLIYDFMYKGDTVYSMQLDVNDSFKIENNENYMAVDIPQLLGWKNVITNNFQFNYDKLKNFIKNNANIDTAYKDITIGYKSLPNTIKQNKKYFVETKYYWQITIYSKKRNADDTYDIIQQNREIRIDTETGRVILDKLLEEPFGYK